MCLEFKSGFVVWDCSVQTTQTVHVCVCWRVCIRWEEARNWLGCTRVCGCGQHMGNISRGRGTKNILHLTLTRLINADHAAFVLELLTERSRVSKRHTLPFKSQFCFQLPLHNRRNLLAGSYRTWSWATRDLTGDLLYLVHLKSNQREAQWGFIHKDVTDGSGEVQNVREECYERVKEC